MKTISIIIVFLLSVPYSYGQLTIKPSAPHHDSYLYVDGTLIFVKQDVNLEKNSEASPTEASIYLRRDAQLIQGKGESATNSGDGLLSVFQEGTSNAYDYNYWSSPVSDGLIGNGNFGIQMLYSPLSVSSSQLANYFTALDGIASPLTISSRWIFTYSGNSYSDWKPIMEKTGIPAGYGFTMKGVNGIDHTTVDGIKNNPGNAQRYDFRGKPNNGPVSVPLTSEEYTLVGNPFPSALDLSLFLLENSGTGTLSTSCTGPITRKPVSTGIAYFWDSMENGNSHYLKDYVGGYGAFSPVDPCTAGIYERPIFRSYKTSGTGGVGSVGEHYDRRFLPIAQGFMVKGVANSAIIFENSHRTFRKEGDLSQFKQPQGQQSSNNLIQIPLIRLTALINNDYNRHLTLAFWSTATPEVDLGMDAAAYNTAPTDIGVFHNAQNYVIDVRPFSETVAIPIYLNVEDAQASLEIRVTEVENFQVENMYIFDSLYNIYFPIFRNVFRIKLEKGTYHDRFKIVFQENGKIPLFEDASSQELIIYQNNTLDRLDISHSSKKPIESVAVFDLLGKQIFYVANINDENFSISTSTFANSVYIVRVKTKDQNFISKQIKFFNPR